MKDGRVNGAAADEVSGLRAQVGELSRLVGKQQQTIESQKVTIEGLLKRLYGRKTERFDPSQQQFDGLVIEASDAAAAAGESEDDVPEPPAAGGVVAKRRRPYNRHPLPEQLRREVVVLEVSEAERVCECGKACVRIGVEVTERLDYTPSSMFVRRYERPMYACGCGEAGVRTAALPETVVEKGLAEVGLVAQVLVSKYADHLPLYRQEQIYARQGVRLSRRTLCDWVQAGGAALALLRERQRRKILDLGVAQSDDTPVDLLQDEGPPKTARLWVSVAGYGPPACVYDFTRDRGGEHPKAQFKGFAGKLVCDAYGGYAPLFETNRGIVPSGCWAHTRRYFHESLTTQPEEASEVMVAIRELYRVEAEVRGKPAEEILAAREEQSRPKVDRLEELLKGWRGKWLPKSPMGTAVEYALGIWERLQVYLTDGRVPIDNNAAERAIRPVAIGRKNWLFVGSEAGGEAGAIILGLVQTCKLIEVDPWRYLRDVLSSVGSHPSSRIDELLPQQWKAAHP